MNSTPTHCCQLGLGVVRSDTSKGWWGADETGDGETLSGRCSASPSTSTSSPRACNITATAVMLSFEPRSKLVMTKASATCFAVEAASALGSESPRTEAGKIYVLDMGEPVKIFDLAQQMIRLAGLRPDKDIEIAITGLRPGEKLREEVFHPAEPLVHTSHPGLRLASPRTVNLELLSHSFDDLATVTSQRREADLVVLLHRLVPEYGTNEGRSDTAAIVS